MDDIRPQSAPQKAADELARTLYGMSRTDALLHGLCVRCKQQALPACYSEAGRNEYRLSGLCEPCFDEIATED